MTQPSGQPNPTANRTALVTFLKHCQTMAAGKTVRVGFRVVQPAEKDRPLWARLAKEIEAYVHAEADTGDDALPGMEALHVHTDRHPDPV